MAKIILRLMTLNTMTIESKDLDMVSSEIQMRRFLENPDGVYRVKLNGRVVLVPRHAVAAVEFEDWGEASAPSRRGVDINIVLGKEG